MPAVARACTGSAGSAGLRGDGRALRSSDRAWAQHTVRRFFAGLKKKGHTVKVLDRVRQVGAGSAGAKGSYSIYRLGEAG